MLASAMEIGDVRRVLEVCNPAIVGPLRCLFIPLSPVMATFWLKSYPPTSALAPLCCHLSMAFLLYHLSYKQNFIHNVRAATASSQLQGRHILSEHVGERHEPRSEKWGGFNMDCMDQSHEM